MADERTGLSSAGQQRLEAVEERLEALVRLAGDRFNATLLQVQADAIAAAAPADVPVAQVEVDALQKQIAELTRRLNQNAGAVHSASGVPSGAEHSAAPEAPRDPPGPFGQPFEGQRPMVQQPGPTA